MDYEKKNDLTADADGIIEGRNAVIEALRAGERIDKIYLQKGETDKALGNIRIHGPCRRHRGWWRPTGASWTA